jgi:UDP-N-acetylmuramoylalanine--D-glutamate ligase
MTKMEIVNTFKGKKVLVVGLRRSGLGAANLLQRLGAMVTVNDRESNESLSSYVEKLDNSVEVITDGHPEHLFNEADMIVVSPGVPLDIPQILSAMIKGVPVIGELELAYRVVTGYGLQVMDKDLSPISLPRFIAITGTNGKSTTTTLVDLMLKRAGIKSLLAGNIGNALTEEILKWVEGQMSPCPLPLAPDFVVTEVSSFQLESISTFRPWISAILNITPDHLDRYEDMDEYIDTKARIFENQLEDDYLILNADGPIMEVISERLKIKSERPKVLYFSLKKEVEGMYFKDGVIYANLPSFLPPPFHLIKEEDIRIRGIHNLENTMASSMIALLCGVSVSVIRGVLKEFNGLEHRLEYLCEISGVAFINDSKGTNTGAVKKSLEGLDRVILIMGGMDKGEDFSVLRDVVKERVRALVLLGQAKEKIRSALGDVVETFVADNMDEAVRVAFSMASAGDTVMLSPGCASFDMFRDFEERGRRFKEAVRGLKDES